MTLERVVVSHSSKHICEAKEAACPQGYLPPTLTKLPFAIVEGLHVSAGESLSLGDVQ